MYTFKASEVAEQIDEILRLVIEDGVTIEITERNEAIAYFIPAKKSQQSIKESRESFLKNLDELAAQIGAKLPEQPVDAVEIVRDIRRDL